MKIFCPTRSSQHAPTYPHTHTRTHPLTIAALATTLLLAGCGSGGGGSTTPTPSNPYTATFREFVVPVSSNVADPIPGSWPDDIDFDNQGNIWFAEHHSNEIGEFVATGGSYQYKGYQVPTLSSVMDSVAVDRQRGIVWAAENVGNKIARLNLNTVPPSVTEINAVTPTNANPVPGDLAVDSTGNLWYTEPYEGDISVPVAGVGRVDSITNAVTEFHVPTQPNGLDGLAFDRAGALWCVEIATNKIAHYVNGSFTEYTLPRPNVTPTNIGIDSHGIVWVTEQDPSGNALAAFNPADTTGHPWRELPVPTASSWPAGLSIDSKDNIWFTEFNSNKIGVLPAGTSTIVDFPIPTANSGPEDVRTAPNGHVFFTEQYGNKVGELVVPGLTSA